MEWPIPNTQLDHTLINFVPGSSWTLAQKGAKRNEMIGLDDKHQTMAVVYGILSDDFLPLQLIYTGKQLPACQM